MIYETIILAAAKAAKVSGALLLAICTHESGLQNVLVPHDGGSPTYGICQVKFETAKMLGFQGKAKDLMVPKINAKWAAQYLKYQKERYDGEWMKAVAAYNSGTYNPSSKVPGCPRNLKYVKHVQRKLAEHLQEKLSCGTTELESNCDSSRKKPNENGNGARCGIQSAEQENDSNRGSNFQSAQRGPN